VRDYKKYDVWKNAKSLVKEIYVTTARFPPDERFVITSQIRRAVISIPLNIAEGSGRRTEKDFRYFLFIALGSSYELDTLIDLTVDLQYLNEKEAQPLKENVILIQKQLNSLINTITKSIN